MMQNHNEYLKQLENYLQDLSVMERAKILSEANEEISTLSLPELEDPLTYINKKRAEAGFIPYQEKQKFSLFKFIAKFFAFMVVCSMIFVGFLVWKFTPLMKIDEEKNRVIILGGLIDIDGKAGKVKIFDEVQFTEDKYTNDLQASFTLDNQRDEVIVSFNSGQFNIENSASEEFSLECKLSSPADNKMIQQESDHIKINFNHITGQTCKILIPRDKRVTLEGNEAGINIIKPEFNTYIELKTGSVAITPEQEIDYKFDLEVKDGYIGNFTSSENETAYEIKVTIDQGSIVTK